MVSCVPAPRESEAQTITQKPFLFEAPKPMEARLTEKVVTKTFIKAAKTPPKAGKVSRKHLTPFRLGHT